MPFNSLPTEIIRTIFYIHVHIHLQPRHPLLFTCRLWHDVATNYSLLWKRMGMGESYAHGHPTSIRCHTLHSLARSIRRAGTGIHLHLQTNEGNHKPTEECVKWFIKTVGHGWVDGIQTLSVSRNSQDDSDPFLASLGELLRHTSLKSLRKVSCHGDFSSNVIQKLFPQMESAALELMTLEIEALFNPILPKFWLPYPLARISSLHLECSPRGGTFIPWSELKSLKLLDLYQYQAPNLGHAHLGLSTVEAPHLSDLRLGGGFDQTDFFSLNILEKLSRLCLDFSLMDSTMFPQIFPALTALDIRRTPSVMSWFNAPQLVELTIGISVLSNADASFFNALVTPRIMRISIDFDDDPEFINALDGRQAGSAAIWSQVEELHISFFDNQRQLPLWLVRSLLGDGLLTPCFPKLKHLTSRYCIATDQGLPRSQKRASVHQLLHIMYTRIAAGFPRLATLEVGWHPCNYELGSKWGQEEWYLTKWHNCLEGIQEDMADVSV